MTRNMLSTLSKLRLTLGFLSCNSLCSWGPRLGVSSAFVSDMFDGAEQCPSAGDPNLSAIVPGPFCYPCSNGQPITTTVAPPPESTTTMATTPSGECLTCNTACLNIVGKYTGYGCYLSIVIVHSPFLVSCSCCDRLCHCGCRSRSGCF